MFTEKFIRDTVLPAVESTGGATVLTSPYGMPPSLLVMDQYQPPTWVVGSGVEPVTLPAKWMRDAEYIAMVGDAVYESAVANSWSAVGFWVNDGTLYVEPVQVFTNHYMAIEAGRERDQLAIYAAHRGELEWLNPAPRGAGALVPPADR